MKILDAKVMKVQKMLTVVHCCKHYERNTCNGFVSFFLFLHALSVII